MTWLTTFYLRAFVVILQVALIFSDENGPMPGFKQQPADTLAESENITILCDVKGDKLYNITWLKDDQNLDLKHSYLTISAEGSLNIFNAQRRRDQGKYRCIVANSFGTVRSREAELSFPYLDRITEHTMTRIVKNEGMSAILPCNPPNSNPPGHIEWDMTGKVLQLGSSHFSKSLDGDLYFAYTKSTDHGTYRCDIDNDHLGQYRSKTVVLEVRPKNKHRNVKPGVFLFKNKIALENSNFILECISSGRPIPDMKLIQTSTGKELTTAKKKGNNLRFTFGKFTAEHAGQYKCEVSSSNGQASSTAYISMRAKPKFKVHQYTRKTVVDVSFKLPCVATAIPEAKYTWFYNGIQLHPKTRGLSIYNGNLTIYNMHKWNQGVYQCAARNAYGEDILTVYVEVFEYKPEFVDNSNGARIERTIVGITKEISCLPMGAPKPEVKWVKQHVLNLMKNERFTKLSTNSLRIKNVKKSDEGTYECIASNKKGYAVQKTILRVEDSIAITQRLTKNNTLTVGEDMVLTCKIEKRSGIEVLFKWYKGRRLLKSKRNQITIQKISSVQSKLTIKNAQQTHSGQYTCKVIGGGNAEETERIYVYDRPDPPMLTSVVPKTGAAVKITWKMQKDNGDKAFQVYIQAKANFEGSDWKTIKISNKTSDSKETEVVQLSPWVTYEIALRAENRYGISRRGKESTKSIKTPTAKPIKYPQNLQGIGISPNELRISFDPLAEIDQNAPDIKYIVYHREVNGTYDMVSNIIEDGQNYVVLQFHNQDSYYKKYEFQVQAKNNEGFGPKSPVQTAYTGERRPLVAPDNLKVKILSPKTALATWNNVSTTRTRLRGHMKGYKLLYWQKSSSTYGSNENYIRSKTNRATIVRLRPYTEYYFAVMAYNDAGNGPESFRIGPIRTPEAKPTQPANFQVTEASNTYIKLSWDEPLYAHGELIKYILRYQTSSGIEVSETLQITKTSHLLQDLSPSKLYRFKLSAVNNAGEGSYAEVQFDFSRVPKIKPEKPNVASVGHNAIGLSWTPVSAVDITGYMIFYRSKGVSEKVRAMWEDRDDVATTIKNLEEHTTYYIQIAVQNDYGIGPRSDITKTRTKSKATEKPKTIAGSNEKSKSRSNELKITNYVIIILILVAILVPR
ncbi:contactin-3-like isoform X3 [Hydractinia symbiolongicarpus]|uniref:contactin-3-like isoform X3 n=1 Tax=Hydractinia symbiolongicarpus TaxID=13093 RepID=UPI00254CA775|nr:contactin-3-like isoform X3 [Hydractinia symbiolongicarpus]